MRELYDWIRGLAGYLIFLAVLEQLLPEKQYVKYVRLLSGIVFLLLAVRPFADGNRLAGRMDSIFRELELKGDARSLEGELSGAGEKQRERLFAVYEQAVAGDVGQMARELGLEVREADVSICRDEADAAFGTVTHIRVTAERGEANSAAAGLTPEKAAKLRQALRSCYHLEDADVEIGAVAGEG